jgi:hypothetical protein
VRPGFGVRKQMSTEGAARIRIQSNFGIRDYEFQDFMQYLIILFGVNRDFGNPALSFVISALEHLFCNTYP